MESVVLETPAGIQARLGWSPATTAHDRRRILARELVAARTGIDPVDVRITREEPTNFGHHTRLIASVGEEALPVVIKTTDYRAATVVAIADDTVRFGIDLRDLHPDAETEAYMHAHSHLWEGSSESDFLRHWTRVQAVLAADGRGLRILPEAVRLDPASGQGAVADRPVQYRVLDISRSAFVITLAYTRVDPDEAAA